MYLAVIFGSSVRQRGTSQNLVLYPAEVYDDGDISESGVLLRDHEHVSFIRGWNFVTDLYRILEHFIEKARRHPPDQNRPADSVTRLFPGTGDWERWSGSDVLQAAEDMYNTLPVQLREARLATGDMHQDRYGFQGTVPSPWILRPTCTMCACRES